MMSVTVTNNDCEKNPHHFLSRIAAFIPGAKCLSRTNKFNDADYGRVAAVLLMVRS
jgi:hypothetical protein